MARGSVRTSATFSPAAAPRTLTPPAAAIEVCSTPTRTPTRIGLSPASGWGSETASGPSAGNGASRIVRQLVAASQAPATAAAQATPAW